MLYREQNELLVQWVCRMIQPWVGREGMSVLVDQNEVVHNLLPLQVIFLLSDHWKAWILGTTRVICFDRWLHKRNQFILPWNWIEVQHNLLLVLFLLHSIILFSRDSWKEIMLHNHYAIVKVAKSYEVIEWIYSSHGRIVSSFQLHRDP